MRRILAIFFLAVACFSAGASFPLSMSAWAQDPLRLYREGKFADASKALARDAQKNPNDPVTQYNLGTAAHRAEDYTQAVSAFNQASANATPKLQPRIAYNQGNTLYRLAQKQEAQQPDTAVKAYEQALDAYRLAIRDNPDDRDAPYNYELTKRRLEALKSQNAQQQQQQQKQQGSSQSNQQQAQRNKASSGEQSEQQRQAQSSGREDKDQQQAAQKSESGRQEKGKPEQNGRQADANAAQGEQPQDGQEGKQGKEQAAAQALTREQALWILDTVKSDELHGSPQPPHDPSQDTPVEQDW